MSEPNPPFCGETIPPLGVASDVERLQDSSDQHAVEKEWLYWMVNGFADPVVLTDADNDIILQTVRAQTLFKANADDSEGKRRAIWMYNFLFTADLSNLDVSHGDSIAIPRGTLHLVRSRFLWRDSCFEKILFVNVRSAKPVVVCYVLHARDAEVTDNTLRSFGDALLLFAGECVVAFLPGRINFIAGGWTAVGERKDRSYGSDL